MKWGREINLLNYVKRWSISLTRLLLSCFIVIFTVSRVTLVLLSSCWGGVLGLDDVEFDSGDWGDNGSSLIMFLLSSLLFSSPSSSLLLLVTLFSWTFLLLVDNVVLIGFKLSWGIFISKDFSLLSLFSGSVEIFY